jgi:tight adherence protein C
MTSGRPFSDDDILKFKATQMFAGVVGAIIGLVLGLILFRINIQMLFLLSIVCGFIGFIFPKIRLRMITKRRYAEIAYNLPDSLDLLVVCVEAGLGLDAALTRVATEQMRTAPVLAREFGRVSKEILAGIPRQEAFRNLAIRNNVDDLKSFVALLVQTDKLGTSIAQSLRVYADTVRTKRRQKAEKLAAEASVKMVIPLVLFILPSMFVVLLGPAILNLIEQFAGG